MKFVLAIHDINTSCKNGVHCVSNWYIGECGKRCFDKDRAYIMCRRNGVPVDNATVPDQGCAGPVAYVNRGAPPPTLAAKTGVTE